MSADRTWMAQAACRGYDPELWFPPQSTSAFALAACGRCPVRNQCADYADANHERFGIWGGLNTEQRYKRARKRLEVAA